MAQFVDLEGAKALKQGMEGYIEKVLPSQFSGATSTEDGTSGLVPKPTASDKDKFLKGDGTWGDASTGSVTSVGVSMPNGFEVSDSPITSSGTIAITYDEGYSVPFSGTQSEINAKILAGEIPIGSIVNITDDEIDTPINAVDIEYSGSVSGATNVKDALDTLASLPEPMVFKGSLGVDGTITELPTAAKGNTGYTYKVITDGTYAGQEAYVGDTFISDGSEWVLIPSGDEASGTVKSVGVSVPTGLSVSNSPITSSGTIAITYATGYSIPTEAKQSTWDGKEDHVDLITSAQIDAMFAD